MRLIGRFAASFWLGLTGPVLAGTAMLGAGALASAGPAAAAGLTSSTSRNSSGASATADPSTATPGTSVTFQVFCNSLTASSATFVGTTLGLPSQIPMNKELGGGVFSITVTLPGNILPGVFHPDIDCSDGSSATARIKVTPFPSQGGAATGDGTTATQTDNGMAYGGLALIGIGAVAGGIAVRRRSTRRF
jgi:hypothetical protein